MDCHVSTDSLGCYVSKNLVYQFFFYYTEENVSDVTAAVFVKYGAIPYFDGTYNLCKMNILNCPLKAGNGSTVFKYTLIQYQYIVSIIIGLTIDLLIIIVSI